MKNIDYKNVIFIEKTPIILWVKNANLPKRLSNILISVYEEDLKFRNKMLYLSDIKKEDFLKWKGTSLRLWNIFVKERGF